MLRNMKLDLGAVRIDVPESYGASTVAVAGPEDKIGTLRWRRLLTIRFSPIAADSAPADVLSHAGDILRQRLQGATVETRELSVLSRPARHVEVRHKSQDEAGNAPTYTFAILLVAEQQLRSFELTVLDDANVIESARQQFTTMIGSLSTGTALARSTSAARL